MKRRRNPPAAEAEILERETFRNIEAEYGPALSHDETTVMLDRIIRQARKEVRQARKASHGPA